MKKIAKIVGGTFLVLLILLMLLPFVFKGKMTKLVKEQGNEMIRGEFDFSSLDMSFFAHFPKATISLNDFWLRGEGTFEKDTLAKVNQLSVTVDLYSLFGEQYKVENIYLKDASFKAVVAKNGQTNWDIMKETAEIKSADESVPATAFDLLLKRVEVKNMSVVYDDRQEGTLQAYENINMNVSAQLQNGRYELINSSLEINDLKAYVEGWVALPEGLPMDYDVDLKTDKAILNLSDMPEVHVAATHLHATPKLITLAPTAVLIAHSDMTIDCTIHNIGSYLTGKGILSGKMNMSSTLLDLNDFMSDEELLGAAEENTSEETSEVTPEAQLEEEASSVIEVPSNIDFVIETKIQTIKMKSMELTQLTGQLLAKNKTLTMKDLAFDVMKGQVKMNGSYTAADITQPTIDAQLSIENVSFAEAYKESEVIKKLVPIFSHAQGTFSSTMSLAMILDNQMDPVMKSVQGQGHIYTDSILITDVAVLDKMASALKKPELANLKTKDLDVAFTVKDGLVTTSPFDLNVGDYKLTLGGQTGLDKSINYGATVVLPEGEKIVGLSEVNLTIGGTFDKPSVKVDSKKLIKNLFQSSLSSLTKNDSTSTKKNVVEKGKSLLKGLFK
ncbi:MAG: AsmA-like C-terminal region-containing protein [Bacteroidaceae bacterium]